VTLHYVTRAIQYLTVSTEGLSVGIVAKRAVDQRVDIGLTRHIAGLVFSLSIEKLCRLKHHFICVNKYRVQKYPTAASPVCSVLFLVRASPRLIFFCCFTQSLQANAAILPNIVSLQLPYTFSAIHHAHITIN